MAEAKVGIHINIPEKLFRKFKIFCAETDVSMTEVLIEAIKKVIKK